MVSGSLVVLLLRNIPPLRQRDSSILASQTVILFSVVFLIHFPKSTITRIVSWSSVLFSFLGPTFTSSSDFIVRLVSIFLGISIPFSLLSISYESLFLPCLFFVLLHLIKLEVSHEEEDLSWRQFLSSPLPSQDDDGWRGHKEYNLQKSFRRAWFHVRVLMEHMKVFEQENDESVVEIQLCLSILQLFFVFLSFFGTGNIGSVSSFDPTAVRCFVNIFSPFVMMVALLEKIVGPFLLVSCFFRMLLWSRVQVERNFLIVLFLCQGMALHTFFIVRNTGSWLEIGTSISHYVIVQCTTLFLFLLHFSSNFLISASLLPSHISHITRSPDSVPVHKTK